MATLKEQFEGHTLDIITATQTLLEGLSDREGQYVWKKFSGKEVTLHFTYTGVSTVKVTSSDTDLTKVDSSYFAGVKTWYSQTNYPLIFKSSTEAIVGTAGTPMTYTYDPSTTTITFSGGISSNTIPYGDAVVIEGEGASFVTADDENSYPEEGELDGYHYKRFDIATLIAENIREGVDIWGVIGAMKEGVSGIDYGTITISAEKTKTLTFSHNLKVAPRAIALVPLSTTFSTSYTIVGEVAVRDSFTPYNGEDKLYGWYTTYTNTSTSLTVSELSNLTYVANYTLGASTITIKHENSYGGYAKGTYVWIAIA